MGFTRSDVFDDGVARPGGVLLTDAEALVADAYVLALASALELGYFGPIDVVFEVAHERPGVPLTYYTLDDETGDLLQVTNTRTTPGPLYGHTEFTRDTNPQDVHRAIHAMASELVGRFGLATQLVDLLPPDAPDYEGDPLDMIRHT
ncbi:hypothetical protein [Agilicoccus flavus]|uniref:hypothetical protein n=1 Tax=Agilicoccus flavus TaxID=2775968 RepID=UPI001CF6F498|nr:hypothetical protein [Agilicoccus flavus]